MTPEKISTRKTGSESWLSTRGTRVTYAPMHNLFIVEHGGGFFHAINTSMDIMMRMHPPVPAAKQPKTEKIIVAEPKSFKEEAEAAMMEELGAVPTGRIKARPKGIVKIKRR